MDRRTMTRNQMRRERRSAMGYLAAIFGVAVLWICCWDGLVQALAAAAI